MCCFEMMTMKEMYDKTPPLPLWQLLLSQYAYEFRDASEQAITG